MTISAATSEPAMSARIVDIRVLGPVEVVAEGRQLGLGGPKQRTVLAMLVAEAGHPVSIGALIHGVYGDEASDRNRHSIQTYISNLRAELAIPIEFSADSYTLATERDRVDAYRFEEVVRRCRQGETDPEDAGAALREALALWRGHPYADIDAHGSLEAEIARLNELRMEALAARIDADLAAGRHQELIAELEALTVDYPLREEFRAQQMLALYRSGRQADALRAYERTRTYLVDELGLDPSVELRQLEQQILEQDAKLAFSVHPKIGRSAIMVADVGDPESFAHVGVAERNSVIRLQNDILDDAIVTANGSVFAHRGTAVYATFGDVSAAARAAGQAQRSLAASGSGLAVRIAVDFGDVEHDPSGEVSGPPVGRSAALVASAHPGQVLLTGAAHDDMTAGGGVGWMTLGLGTHHFPGIDTQLAVHQLVVDGSPTSFPPLKTNTIPPPLPVPATGIPGYEFRDEVGSGAFGVVHRAYQPSVGREVAIKIIRPEFANDPEFIRRFEVEAQLVARLEHPHIVPLHDYWRGPDGGFLVMRWLDGGSLNNRLASRQLDRSEASELLAEIGPALDYAHRHGVVHRDLKPSNILFDTDGNAYLSDFGIAVSESDQVGPGDDCSAFARLLVAAVGEEVIDPGVSYGNVAELVEAWDEAMGDISSASSVTFTPARNPYKGLRAFAESDAEDFYGRTAEVDKLIDVLSGSRLVAAVGPSGIGKSSVVRAGLIPSLRSGAITGSEMWLITDLIPGAYPYEALASALIRVASRMPVNIESELRRDERGLIKAVSRYLPEGTELLVVIDQFEELFTLTADDADRKAFLDLVAASAGDPRSRVRFVLTMRGDFFDRPLMFAKLGEFLGESTVPIAAPTEDDLRAMIAEPAAAAGVGLEDALVDRIVADVINQPGALPMLEFALTELFEHRDSDVLTVKSYETSGGVLGALGRRAESIYQELEPGGREATSQVFLRLVNVSESGRDTRRRVRRSELERLGFTDNTLSSVLEAYGEHRLLTFDRDPTTRGPTVEVAHEAILTEWPRLADWVEIRREDLLLHSRLSVAVADWEADDRADTYLLTGGRLDQHEAWTADTDLTLTSAERDFLKASRHAEDERRARRRRTRRLVVGGFGIAALVAGVLAVAALIARNNASHQADLAEASRLATAAVDVLSDDPELALLLALESANRSTEVAFETRRALHAAIDRNRAVARLPFHYNTQWTTRSWISSDGSLLAVTGEHRAPFSVYRIDPDGSLSHLWTDSEIPDDLAKRAMFSPDGERVVVWATSPQVLDVSVAEPEPGTEGLYIFESKTGELVSRPETPECPQHTYSLDVGFLPDLFQRGQSAASQLVAGWCVDPGLLFQPPTQYETQWWLVDSTTGEIVERHLDPRGIYWIAASSDGSRLLIQHADGVEIRDRDTGDSHSLSVAAVSASQLTGLPRPRPWLTLSPDGSVLFHEGRLLDAESGELMVELDLGELWESCSQYPVFSPDSTMVMVGCEDSRVHIFSATTGEHLDTLVGHSGWAVPGGFGPAKGLATSSSSDGFVRVWDISIRGEIQTIELDLGYKADAGLDVSGGAGVALIYPTETESLFNTFRSFMMRHAMGKLQFFDINSGAITMTVEGVGGKVVRFSPDGSVVAAQSSTEEGIGNVLLFDAATGEVLFGLPGLCRFMPGSIPSHCDDQLAADVTDIAWSPNGKYLAIAGGIAQKAVVWDMSTRQIEFVTELSKIEPFSSIAFSPDGTLLAVSSKSAMWVYDTSTWDLATEPIAHVGRPSWVMQFSADGTELITAQAHSGDIRIYDTTTWEERNILGGPSQTRDMAISDDESMVALADRDGGIHVLDLQTGDLIELISQADRDITNIEFINDDRHLLITSSTGPAEILTLDPNELVNIARSRISRGFSAEECEFYQLDPCPTHANLSTG